MQKKVLITGGAGFIGSNLTAEFLREGHKVFSVDNLITSDRNSINEFADDKNFHFLEKDINTGLGDFEKMSFDEIFHLACPTGVDNLIRLGEEMIITSVVGTKNVLDFARRKGGRVIFTSSSEVYGDPLLAPQTEKYVGNVSPVGIRSAYEEGKRAGESVVMLYVRKYGVSAVIARVFNTYGPRMNMHDSRVIPKFLASIQKGEALPIHGEGAQMRTFCYVDDLVSGLVLLASRGVSGEIYNLGSREQVKIFELAEKMKKMSGNGVKFKKIARPDHDHKSRMPDILKVSNLGWEPKVSLDEGLKKMLWST